MATKYDLRDWLVDALQDNGGQASIVEVCRYIWHNHEDELRSSGDFFFTWQYEVRWAATELRQTGVMKHANQSPRGIWELASSNA